MKETETRMAGESVSRGRFRRGRRASRRTNAPSFERILRENAAGLTFLGVTLGVFVSRKFLILPVAIGLMLAQEKLADAGLERARRAVL
jgi:hypothetical protein